MIRFVKLVRDRINQWGEVKEVRYERIPDAGTHMQTLRHKLIEEALEYWEDPSLGELADVYEVVRTLVILDLRSSEDILMRIAKEKRVAKGGFLQGLGMYVEVDEPGV